MYTPQFTREQAASLRESYEHHTGETWDKHFNEEKAKDKHPNLVIDTFLEEQLLNAWNEAHKAIQGDH